MAFLAKFTAVAAAAAEAVSNDAPLALQTKDISPVWSRGGERLGMQEWATGPDLENEMWIVAVATEVTVCELCKLKLLCKVWAREL